MVVSVVKDRANISAASKAPEVVNIPSKGVQDIQFREVQRGRQETLVCVSKIPDRWLIDGYGHD